MSRWSASRTSPLGEEVRQKRHTFSHKHLFMLVSLGALFSDSFCSATSENRINSRVVKTKYGNLRGFYANLPNKNLQPVETFLGNILLGMLCFAFSGKRISQYATLYLTNVTKGSFHLPRNPLCLPSNGKAAFYASGDSRHLAGSTQRQHIRPSLSPAASRLAERDRGLADDDQRSTEDTASNAFYAR